MEDNQLAESKEALIDTVSEKFGCKYTMGYSIQIFS